MKQKYLESTPREPDAGMQWSGTWLACNTFKKSLLLTVHKVRKKRVSQVHCLLVCRNQGSSKDTESSEGQQNYL